MYPCQRQYHGCGNPPGVSSQHESHLWGDDRQPALTVLDIERFAAIAHAHGVPMIVDNTFATLVLCKPFNYGADIIVHSTSKYMDGHAAQIGGAIVDSGKFDWTNGNSAFLVSNRNYFAIRHTVPSFPKN